MSAPPKKRAPPVRVAAPHQGAPTGAGGLSGGPAPPPDGPSAPTEPTSAYIGVCWHKQIHRWTAGIRHMGKRRNLGTYNDEAEAARAFDAAAREQRPQGEAHGGRLQ